MKKMILLSFLLLFIPVIVYGQDKVEAPVWNVGDKWTFTSGATVMIINADENSYTGKFLTSKGEEYISIYDKSSLNRLYSMEGNRRIQYKGMAKRLLNFPFYTGKSWKDNFTGKYVGRGSTLSDPERQYLETHTILGWEDIEVQAGKFKALKLEYKQTRAEERPGRPNEGKAWYWFSPDVKYLVKYQYENSSYWGEYSGWELTSFELKK